MTKDTSRTEEILSHVKEARRLVRLENDDGLNVDDVHASLLHVEESYGSRLRDLKEWNARQPKAAQAEAKAEPQPESQPEHKHESHLHKPEAKHHETKSRR